MRPEAPQPKKQQFFMPRNIALSFRINKFVIPSETRNPLFLRPGRVPQVPVLHLGFFSLQPCPRRPTRSFACEILFFRGSEL